MASELSFNQVSGAFKKLSRYGYRPSLLELVCEERWKLQRRQQEDHAQKKKQNEEDAETSRTLLQDPSAVQNYRADLLPSRSDETVSVFESRTPWRGPTFAECATLVLMPRTRRRHLKRPMPSPLPRHSPPGHFADVSLSPRCLTKSQE